MLTVLITGANRGIGLYLTKLYLARGDTVVAAVRKVEGMPALDGKLVVVPYDAADEAGATRTVDAAKAKGVDKLDIVIANAGVNLSPALFHDVSPDELAETFRINVIGPVLLFQATLPLLAGGKFVGLSSGMGSTTLAQYPMTGSYSMSKAALNHFVKKVHIEEPTLTAFTVNPGWLATCVASTARADGSDMGSQGAAWYGMDKTLHDIDETLPMLFKVIDSATRDTHGGKLVNYNGDDMPY